MNLEALKIKIFADGADKEGIHRLSQLNYIHGLTTNPTLMRKAGIQDYEAFVRDVLEVVSEKPISFEVFSDEFPEMRRQALKLAKYQDNVYVKIPISNTKNESSVPLIKELSAEGVKVNATALMTEAQALAVADCLTPGVPVVISVFAGRVADTGRDPVPMMRSILEKLDGRPEIELLWASCREAYNIIQADSINCHIVTVTHDLLKKAMTMFGKDLDELSLETVQMFERDAREAGYSF